MTKYNQIKRNVKFLSIVFHNQNKLHLFPFISTLDARKQRIMIEDKSAIYAEKLKHLRINQFISQQEMAIKFKITQQAYSKLEKGDTKFNTKKIEKICKFFKVPVAEFITINIAKTKNKKSKSLDSYNIKVLKQYYERLLLEKDIRIGKLEIELMHHKPIIKPTKKFKEIRVMA